MYARQSLFGRTELYTLKISFWEVCLSTMLSQLLFDMMTVYVYVLLSKHLYTCH